MRERKQHITRIQRVMTKLNKYPTKEEKIWILLTNHLKDITYDDYLVIYNKLT